jgi:CBS domain containing-hemolysin-like protein
MLTSTLELLVAMGLVVANAFFVASEFAIVKMRPSRLAELVAQGNRRAKVALDISHRLDAYLSANQLGITLASLALGWIGEDAFARLLEPAFRGLGDPARHTVAVTASFATITLLHTVIGELAPKSIAIQRTEPTALWTAVPLRAFYVVAFPIIWLLNNASGLVLRLIGLRRVPEVDALHSPAELRMVLQHVAIEPSARKLMDRVFDYSKHLARHVMTLRADTIVLETEKSFDQNLATVLAQQYTRYPLFDSANDRVVGYIHIKDIFATVVHGGERYLSKLVRQPIYCFEDTPLEEIRREIQRRGIHLVVVLDPQGTFAGVLTLEDLVEDFMGEIRDEQDAGEIPPLVSAPDGSFEADGRLTLDVLKRELGIELRGPDANVETLGGWLMAQLGGVPHVGDEIDAGTIHFTVLSMHGRRVLRVRGTPETHTAVGL